MKKFTRKGYGRIYVDKKENIEKVKEEIKTMDSFEYEYLPEEMITTIEEYPSVCYTHKFDSLDLDKLTYNLWLKGIHIFCVDNGFNEYQSS
jgi:hypothetical protein